RVTAAASRQLTMCLPTRPDEQCLDEDGGHHVIAKSNLAGRAGIPTQRRQALSDLRALGRCGRDSTRAPCVTGQYLDLSFPHCYQGHTKRLSLSIKRSGLWPKPLIYRGMSRFNRATL